ncbi:MAG: hypothetical protein HXX15_09930 [Rhodopseudomonas sp.]|uniref:hypothetical protein n=1 Tax=Rhodopseudomonas sp. TaxID=1078 RepID=UPI0017DAF9BD|nr:hypothetical protein [Rhodopseudomonas sp.]NVN86392.1 hypothetical protein [Rhodopseudomonas sp.]
MPTLARIAAAGLAVTWVSLSAHAEPPPHFTIWQEFGAVTSELDIPHTLGVVDRIERLPNGKYQVRSGACFVEVSISREPTRDSDGQPLPGASRISRVDISDKRCDR